MPSTPYQTSAVITNHDTPNTVVGYNAADGVAFFGGTPIPQTNAALTNIAFTGPTTTVPTQMTTTQIAAITTATLNTLTTIQISNLVVAAIPILDGVVAALKALNVIVP